MNTIFITGASSGIGKETAKLFSKKGWRVIATMRNAEKGADLAELPGVVLKELDVTDSEQIKRVCEEVMRETLYYELRPYGIAAKVIIPGGTKTNFQTPINDCH